MKQAYLAKTKLSHVVMAKAMLSLRTSLLNHHPSPMILIYAKAACKCLYIKQHEIIEARIL